MNLNEAWKRCTGINTEEIPFIWRQQGWPYLSEVSFIHKVRLVSNKTLPGVISMLKEKVNVMNVTKF